MKKKMSKKNLLGSLIVFALTVRDYILQLDYKEDLEDYIDNLKKFLEWIRNKVSSIYFRK